MTTHSVVFQPKLVPVRMKEKAPVSPDGIRSINALPGDEVEVNEGTARALVRDGMAEFVNAPTPLDELLEERRRAEVERPNPFMGCEIKSVQGPEFRFSLTFQVEKKILIPEFVGVMAPLANWEGRNKSGQREQDKDNEGSDAPALKKLRLSDYVSQPLESYIQENVNDFSHFLETGHCRREMRYRFNRDTNMGTLTIDGRLFILAIFNAGEYEGLKLSATLEHAFGLAPTATGQIVIDQLREVLR